MTPEYIPVLRPSSSQREIELVTKVLESGWWGLGPMTQEFEEKFAKFTGFKYAVGLNNATSALDLSMKVNGVSGGEVIVPALTFVSTGLAPLYNGARVVFADIDEDTLCMDWQDAMRKVTPKTKAIIPVHYGGKLAEIEPVDGVVIVQDAAHATGTRGIDARFMATWSFHAVKNLATGDGGMITTNDKDLYEKLLPMRWCGIDRNTWQRAEKKYGWDYSIEDVGYKVHMNDLTAALGLAQLERINELNARRRYRALQYIHELKDVSWMRLPRWNPGLSWHLFVARVEDRDRFIDHMLARGVSIGVHYKPLTHYPIFEHQELPVTERVWKTLATLPLFPDMTDEQMDHIIKAIRSFK